MDRILDIRLEDSISEMFFEHGRYFIIIYTFETTYGLFGPLSRKWAYTRYKSNLPKADHATMLWCFREKHFHSLPKRIKPYFTGGQNG